MSHNNQPNYPNQYQQPYTSQGQFQPTSQSYPGSAQPGYPQNNPPGYPQNPDPGYSQNSAPQYPVVGYPQNPGAHYQPSSPGYPVNGQNQGSRIPQAGIGGGRPSQYPYPVHGGSPYPTQQSAGPGWQMPFPGPVTQQYPMNTEQPPQIPNNHFNPALQQNQLNPQHQNYPPQQNADFRPETQYEVGSASTQPYHQPGSFPGVNNPSAPFPPPVAAPTDPYHQAPHTRSAVSPPAAAPQSPGSEVQGTVVPVENFNPEADVQFVRKAMKGLGTDEKLLISILASRSNEQRQKLRVTYKQCFGRDLIKDLKSELRGDLEDVMLGMMLPCDEFDAACLRKAVKGLGTNDDALLEILCSRTNEELLAAKAAYTRLYNRDLEKDVRSDTSGDYMRLLLQMCNAARDPDSTPVDPSRAREDATALYEAGEKRLGTDEETFRRIFSMRSWPQLRETFNQYQQLYYKDMTDALRSELSFNFRKAMLAIRACAVDRPDYFAQRLHAAMRGPGTDERALTRLVVSRSEKDMVQVKQRFEARYGRRLEQAVWSECSGHYRRVLLALMCDPQQYRAIINRA